MSKEPGVRCFTDEQVYRKEQKRHQQATHAGSLHAAIAERVLGTIAIAMTEPDGEDSSGRARFKAMPPRVVAQRACDIARHMVAEFQERGWLYEVPFADGPDESEAEEK